MQGAGAEFRGRRGRGTPAEHPRAPRGRRPVAARRRGDGVADRVRDERALPVGRDRDAARLARQIDRGAHGQGAPRRARVSACPRPTRPGLRATRRHARPQGSGATSADAASAPPPGRIECSYTATWLHARSETARRPSPSEGSTCSGAQRDGRGRDLEGQEVDAVDGGVVGVGDVGDLGLPSMATEPPRGRGAPGPPGPRGQAWRRRRWGGHVEGEGEQPLLGALRGGRASSAGLDGRAAGMVCRGARKSRGLASGDTSRRPVTRAERHAAEPVAMQRSPSPCSGAVAPRCRTAVPRMGEPSSCTRNGRDCVSARLSRCTARGPVSRDVRRAAEPLAVRTGPRPARRDAPALHRNTTARLRSAAPRKTGRSPVTRDRTFRCMTNGSAARGSVPRRRARFRSAGRVPQRGPGCRSAGRVSAARARLRNAGRDSATRGPALLHGDRLCCTGTGPVARGPAPLHGDRPCCTGTGPAARGPPLLHGERSVTPERRASGAAPVAARAALSVAMVARVIRSYAAGDDATRGGAARRCSAPSDQEIAGCRLAYALSPRGRPFPGA